MLDQLRNGAAKTNVNNNVELKRTDVQENVKESSSSQLVLAFLKSIGLPEYFPLFEKEALTMEVLLKLTDSDLKRLTENLPLGHALKIRDGVAELQRRSTGSVLLNSPKPQRSSSTILNEYYEMYSVLLALVLAFRVKNFPLLMLWL